VIDFIAGEEHEVTAIVAYRLWEKRGRPTGSPEVDWFAAKNQLAAALAKNETVTPIFGLRMEADEDRGLLSASTWTETQVQNPL